MGPIVLLIGPPGTGKTMLARRVTSILPQLSLEEAIEASTIWSVAGLLPPEQDLLTARPFRSGNHGLRRRPHRRLGRSAGGQPGGFYGARNHHVEPNRKFP